MKNSSLKTLAGIILFNPSIDRLQENIEAIIGQVDRVVLIDNASGNIKEIEFLLSKYPVEIIRNVDNYGVAKALNEIFEYAIKNECDWVLTLDQDSVSSSELVQEYLKYIDLEKAGILTCVIEDRNIKDFEYSGIDLDKCKEINMCITSGSFCSVEAYKKVGGFDNRLFIDWVDFEYCAHIRREGYKIYRIPIKGILHELGRSQIRRIFNKERILLNEAPFRTYYRTRNRIYVRRKYRDIFKYSKIDEVKAIVLDIVKATLYEQEKGKKVKAIIRGIVDSYALNGQWWKK